MEIKIMDVTVKAVENIDAADTTQTVPLIECPLGAYPIAFMGRVKTAFAGVTYPQVKCGITGDTEKFMRDQPIGAVGDLKSGWAPNAQSYCEVLAHGGRVGAETAVSIIGTFTSSAGNLSALTAGEIEFVLVYAI